MDAASNKAAIAPLTMATGGIPRDLGGSAVLKSVETKVDSHNNSQNYQKKAKAREL